MQIYIEALHRNGAKETRTESYEEKAPERTIDLKNWIYKLKSLLKAFSTTGCKNMKQVSTTTLESKQNPTFS